MSQVQRCLALLSFTLFLPLFFALPALGQNSSTITCGLIRGAETSSHTIAISPDLIPVLGGEYTNRGMEIRLRSVYSSLSQGSTPAVAMELKDIVNLAKSHTNPCAEALMAYAQGVTSRTSNAAASTKWFQQAEIGFLAAHSATGLAHAHFELVAATSKVRSANEVSSAFTAVADEFEQTGDARDALSARILAVNSSTSDPTATLNQLITQAQQLHATELEAHIHQTWGEILFGQGKYNEAMLHYRSSDALFITCRCDLDQRAYLQTSMGRIERTQGRPEAAISHYQLALQLQNRSHDRSFVPQTLNAISVAYEAMHQYPLAILHVQRALALARRLHSQQFIDFLEANLGALYSQAGQPQRGLPLLKRATANLGNDYQRCTRHAQLADLYVALHKPHEAEKSISTAIEACERGNDRRNLADNLETRARIRLTDSSSLEDALTDARRSLALIEEIRSHVVPEDAHKRGYNQETIKTYETTIAILTRMNRYSEALEITEQSRARAFLDLLSSPRGASPATISKEMPANSAIPPAKRGGSAQSSSPASLLLESESHASAIQRSEIFAQVRRLHTTLLAFWVTADRLYTWVIPSGIGQENDAVFGVSQPIRASQLESLIQATDPYSYAIRGGSFLPVSYPSQLRAWSSLYQILIAPIASHLPSELGALVTIVPHGPLFRLSFAALLDPNHHYLVEKYAINTIPAVGLLPYTSRNKDEAEALPQHYTLLANPQNMPRLNGVSFPPLPGTAEEIAAIARILPADETNLLQGSHASVTDLLQELPRATVIHFATHAIVSGTDPFGSFLVLDRKAGQSSFDVDGLLTAASIYSLRMHARMVVLSACRTGRGPVSADGVAGLSRAFFYAGSASVLSTLWDVADEPTATLMPLFYNRLTKGESRAQALRLAQLDLIARLRAGRVRVGVMGTLRPLPERPAYWAAFSLSGEP